MNSEILNIIEKRASCRNFQEKEIQDDILDKLLDAACKSPSSGGFQAYSIIKITDRNTKESLAKLCRGQKLIEQAPVSLMFCIDFRRIKRIIQEQPSPFNGTNEFTNLWMSIVDSAISAHTLCLAAESFGLKSVYIGNILNQMDKVSLLLNIPEYVLPSIMVALGYPKNEIKQLRKYPRNIIVHDEKYKDIDINELLDAYNFKSNNWKMKTQDRFLSKIYDSAMKYHGRDYAERCKNYILEKGYISTYQFWFGCYYLKEEGFMESEDFVEFMQYKGFGCI